MEDAPGAQLFGQGAVVHEACCEALWWASPARRAFSTPASSPDLRQARRSSGSHWRSCSQVAAGPESASTELRDRFASQTLKERVGPLRRLAILARSCLTLRCGCDSPRAIITVMVPSTENPKKALQIGSCGVPDILPAEGHEVRVSIDSLRVEARPRRVCLPRRGERRARLLRRRME